MASSTKALTKDEALADFAWAWKGHVDVIVDNAGIRSTELAKAMFSIGMYGDALEVLENRDILGNL